MRRARTIRKACEAETTVKEKECNYLRKKEGRAWGKGEGGRGNVRTASFPDFATLEECESSYS